MTTRRRRGGARHGGQSTVELALLLPVVVVLLLAVLQVGLLARDVLLVTHAAREAARAAAVDPSAAHARGAARASSGLADDRLTVELTGGRIPGSRVRAVVTYRARTSVPLVGALVGDRTLRAAATMRVEARPVGARSEPGRSGRTRTRKRPRTGFWPGCGGSTTVRGELMAAERVQWTYGPGSDRTITVHGTCSAPRGDTRPGHTT